MELDLSEIPPDKQAQVRKKTELIYEHILFRERSNPVKRIVFAKDLEKRLQDFLSSDREKVARLQINEVKSVKTAGKILPIIENNTIHFVLLFDWIVLSSPELFHEILIHEGVHVIDYEQYFNRVGEGPFQEPPQISTNDYYEEFFVWSEYHANRIAARCLKQFNLGYLSAPNALVDSLGNLFQKLREAGKLSKSGEQERADYLVQVALADFFHLYIIAIATSKEYYETDSEELQRLFKRALFKKIFGSTLIRIRGTLEEVFSDKSKPDFEFFPRIREKLESIRSSLNYFRLHVKY